LLRTVLDVPSKHSAVGTYRHKAIEILVQLKTFQKKVVMGQEEIHHMKIRKINTSLEEFSITL